VELFRAALHPVIGAALAVLFTLALASLVVDMFGATPLLEQSTVEVAGPAAADGTGDGGVTDGTGANSGGVHGVGGNGGGAAARAMLVTLLVLLAAIAEVIVGNILKKERASPVQRLREFVLLLAVSYALLAVAQPGPFFQRFIPGLSVIFSLALCALSWILTNRFHSALRAREDFLRTAGGYRGVELERRMRQTRGFATSIIAELKRVRSLGGMLLALLALVVLLARMQEIAVSAHSVILIALFAVSYLICTAATQLFLEEFSYYGEGLPLANRYLRRRMLQALTLVLIAVVFATLLAQHEGHLSLAFLVAIVNWLASLFPGAAGEAAIPQEVFQPPQRSAAYWFDLAQRMDTSTPSRFWQSFFAIARTIVIWLVGIVAVAFVLAPFFGRTFHRAVRRLHPLRALRRAAFGILVAAWKTWRFLRLLFSRRRRRESYEAVTERGLGEGLFDPRRWRRSHGSVRKRLQTGQLWKRYERLLQWTAERGVPRTETETLREHAQRVARRLPSVATPMEEASAIMSEAVYSEHPLTRDRRQELFEAIDEVVYRP
jgi:hypothetical protein